MFIELSVVPVSSAPANNSNLLLFCRSCGWAEDFYTSVKILNQRFFEVSRRLVYAMRSVDCGHAVAKRFCRLMNMPQPPRKTPYARRKKALLTAAKAVAEETMCSTRDPWHRAWVWGWFSQVQCVMWWYLAKKRLFFSKWLCHCHQHGHW